MEGGMWAQRGEEGRLAVWDAGCAWSPLQKRSPKCVY
jgi:hypothetical protein